MGLYRWIILNPFFWHAKHIEGKRIKPLYNLHRNADRCFIVGNGPSIIHHDLTKLKNEIVFVTNWFVNHDQYHDIDPDYYCISDSRPFLETTAFQKLIALLSIKASSAQKFFPLRVRSQMRSCDAIPRDQVWYLDYVLYPIWENREINLKIHQRVYTGDTVVIDFCLPIAYYMGFKKIYLLGCDCTLGDIAGLGEKQRHFFDESKQASKQQTDEYLKHFWFDRVNESYRVFKEVFEKDDRNIFNAGLGGKLDIFQRVDYDQLFLS